jgi:hypothetical protein
MSDNCRCCEREKLKKQCRIDTFSDNRGVVVVKILHLPTTFVVEGTDVDETLDLLAQALIVLEDPSIDTVAKFKKALYV